MNEPPLGLNSSLSHQSAHQGSAGDGGQALPAIWSCKRFQGAVCICVHLCVCVLCAIGVGGGAHTRPVYPPISIRQTARKFQQSAIVMRKRRVINTEDRNAKRQSYAFGICLVVMIDLTKIYMYN